MSMPAFSKLVLFGDSDTDGGEGANGVYELTKKSWPTPPNFKGRFCNGAVWPEYLAPRLNVVYNPKDNFAVGGAKTDRTNFLKDMVFENSGILAQVQNYVHSQIKVNSQTLFAIWGGGANFLEQDISFVDTVEQAINDLEECVDILMNAGAQTVLMGTQPSMGSSPEMRASNKESHFHRLTTQFNEGLSRRVLGWQQKSSTRIILANVAKLATEVFTGTRQLGFTNITNACLVDGIACEDSDSYLYWDGVHFTTAFHRHLAEQFYNAIITEYA